MKGLARKGRRAPSRNAEGDKRDSNGAGHHEGERRVPGAAYIEKREHLAWVRHARKAEANPEQKADEKRRNAVHFAPLEHVADEEDRQKACAHERESRRERATRRDQTWPARME